MSRDNDIAIYCTGRTTKRAHRSKKIAAITWWHDPDDGSLFLFDREFSTSRDRTARRTTPQQPIRATDSQAWRFICPSCRLDKRLSTPDVAALVVKVAAGQRIHWDVDEENFFDR